MLRSELCDKLFITENTLNKHFDNIYKKLNINSYEELLQLIKKR
ncbi:MAG: LuxR C-terminal-related transcriptional regulator [Ruthenibacterium sp.]